MSSDAPPPLPKSDSPSSVPFTLETPLPPSSTVCAQLVLCFQSIYYLLHEHIPKGRRSFYIVFSLLMALMKGTGLMANTLFGQYTWVESRGYPGGPGTYFIFESGWWVNTMGSFSAVIAVGLNDALMLHRVYVILNQNWYTIIIPGLLFLGTTACGLASTGLATIPNASVFRGVSSELATAWIGGSVAYNLLATIMISTRLLHAHRQMTKFLSREQTSTYTGVVAILIESAIPLAVTGLVASVFYGLKHDYAFMFTVLWSFFTGISPQLIILRVSMGKAWSANTMARQQSSLRFGDSNGPTVLGSYDSQATKMVSLGSQNQKGSKVDPTASLVHAV